MLEEALRLQEQTQRDLGFKVECMTPEQVVDYLRDMHLALIAEVVETLNEVEWKPWKPGAAKINHEGFRQELADVVIFTLNLAIAGGVEADELMEYVMDKIRVNRIRLGLT